MLIPALVEISFVGRILNSSTASLASYVLDFFKNESVNWEQNFIVGDAAVIEVKHGCSSINQIILSLNVVVIFYLCAKIKSFSKIFVVLIIALIAPFIFNSLRVSVLFEFIASGNIKFFDLWHDGIGSLIFSMIVTLFTSYYYFWAKENIHNSK